MSRRPKERLKRNERHEHDCGIHDHWPHWRNQVGGATLRVSIASSFCRRENRGEWIERTRWNEVTIFGEASRGYVKWISSGATSSSPQARRARRTNREKDEETLRGVTLAGKRIERLWRGRHHGDDNDAKRQRTTGGRRLHSLLNDVDTPESSNEKKDLCGSFTQIPANVE
jgi:single-strand DNA-binding protein